MKVAIVPVTPFEQNCSILICESTRRAAIVDPGGDIDRILSQVEALKITLEKIFITHGHLDHCGAAATLADQLSLPIEGPHIDDQFWIEQMPEQSQRFGFKNGRTFVPNRWLQDGDTLQFGEVTLQVLHCPGHTPGHLVFYSPDDKIAIVGDVLFAGSIGRTDFPKGSQAALIRSIREKLWPLGNDVTFIPGHGPHSTFGQERLHNPFVADKVLH